MPHPNLIDNVTSNITIINIFTSDKTHLMISSEQTEQTVDILDKYLFFNIYLKEQQKKQQKVT